MINKTPYQKILNEFCLQNYSGFGTDICFYENVISIFTNEKIKIMAKYSQKAQDKVGDVMHEYKTGKLKSSSGDKVKNRKQAIAIGISEAREKGYKTPAKKTATRKSTSSSASRKSSTSRPRSSK